MLIPSLLLFLAVTGAMANDEEEFSPFPGGIGDEGAGFSRCMEMISIENYEEALQMNIRDQFALLCPKFQAFLNCLGGMAKTLTGLTLEELQRNSDNVYHLQAKLIFNTKKAIDEICTVGTPLYTDFMEDIDCFDGVTNNVEAACDPKVNSAYEAYVNYKKSAEERVYIPDHFCLKKGYGTACLASYVHDTCGRRALNTFTRVFSNISVFNFMWVCSAPGSMESLKDMGRQGLLMNEDEKEFLRLTFDLLESEK